MEDKSLWSSFLKSVKVFLTHVNINFDGKNGCFQMSILSFQNEKSINDQNNLTIIDSKNNCIDQRTYSKNTRKVNCRKASNI